MDLSIGRLQQLVTVAKQRSFSRAALELNISQPALSRSIAAMERRYGFPVFNRVGHGVELTAAGAQVIAQAQQLLQNMRVFDSNLRLIGSGKAGQLSIGLAPLLASQILARFTGDFFDPASSAQLKVLIRGGDELLAALKDDEIELFFFPESYLEPSPDIHMETVGHIESAFVVRAGHPLACLDRVTLADLRAYPWASSVTPLFPPEAGSPSHLLCDNFHIMRDALLVTDLVCVCSTEFVASQVADGTLHIVRAEDFPLGGLPIHMASLQGRTHSPLAMQAVARMRAYLADRAGKAPG